MARVYASSVIPAPASAVWSRIRDFNALPRWTPFVAESRIEQNLPSDKVGCIRNFSLKDGGRIREQLLGLSDYDMSCTYAILESPMGVTDYIARLSLTPVTDGNATFAQWQADFDCDLSRERALVEQIGVHVFAAALTALKAHFGGRP
ncbi:MAG: SRPBCC family protein [Rhizobiaceae bacterium]|nr:SRPBCC family protein [Rhizobiaceae bacterium]